MKSWIEVARACIRTEAEAVEGLLPQLDESFNKAVDIVLRCRGKLIVTGVGKSGHIGAKIAATLASTGTSSFFMNALDAYHGDLGMIGTDDVVLAISYSGQTDELLRILPGILSRGVPVIGMSGNPDSLLARNSVVHLNASVRREACPLGLAPTSSTTAALALGDALACALMEARSFKASDFARFHPGGSLGRRLLTRAADVMHTDDLPTVSPSLRMGEALIRMSSGRLGLCVAIDADGRIAGIITDGDIRRAMESRKDRFFNLTVAEVMTRSPKCVQPDTKVNEIEAIMQNRKIHSVLVTDESRTLLGIVDSFSTML